MSEKHWYMSVPPFSQEIYKDRKKFNQNVFEVASSDLINMGITVLSYTLKDIHDDEVRKVTDVWRGEHLG